MEEAPFNAKKSRAYKLKRDKFHTKHNNKNSSNDNSKITKDGPKSKPAAETKRGESGNSECSSEASSLKPKLESPPSESKSFEKRVLASNWGRYEKELDTRISDSEESSGANFDELINLPITAGHFKLKHEYDWDKEKAQIQAPWFQLDLEKLNNSLSTIPFYKRQGLPAKLFTEEKIHQMNVRASQHAAPVRDALEISKSVLGRDTDESINCDQNRSAISASQGSGNSSVKDVHNEIECPVDNDLERLLTFDQPKVVDALSDNVEAMTISPSLKDKKALTKEEQSPTSFPISQHATKAVTPSTSLDDWLDSILDD